MENYIFRILFAGVLFSTILYPQTITFQESYGFAGISDTGHSVQQTADGNYILAGVNETGNINLIKTDSYGNMLWHKEFEESNIFSPPAPLIDVKETFDGGFIILGTKDNATPYANYLIRTDTNGDTLWTKTFENTGYGVAWSILQTADSGFIFLSTPRFFGLNPPHLTKLYPDGTIAWEQDYSVQITGFTMKYSLIDAIDSGYIITVKKNVMKISQEGDLLWTKLIDNESIYSVAQTSDSGYIFSSNRLTKTDADINTIWSVDLEERGTSVTEISDGGYVVLLENNKIVKYDIAGDTLWTKDLSGEGKFLQKTNDGGFITTGELSDDFWLLKSDSNGDYYDVVIIQPNGGEILSSNTNYKVEWLSDNIDFIKIEYSTDDGNSWILVEDNFPADSGYFNWKVPVTNSDSCKVKITDKFNSSILDENNHNFIIHTGGSYDYIAVNEIKMWIGNNGDGSHDPFTDGNGFYWPGGEDATQSAIFEDGLVFGGIVDGEIRVNGNTHRQGLQPGIILPNGLPDDRDKPEYGIWKLKRGWENLPGGIERDLYEYNYNNWPVNLGAPYVDVNGDGEYTSGVDYPDYIGDEILFYVANDMDTSLSTFTYGTNPMGLEFQTIVFGFDRVDELKNVVYKKYKIINKGSNNIIDMIFGYWSDIDLGNANDDYSGCDTLLSLSYCYNETNFDEVYGTPPPAVGHKIVQGPIVPGNPTDSAMFNGEWRKGFRNLSNTAFAMFLGTNEVPWRDPQQGVPQGSVEFYNYLNGLLWDGSEFIDPHTNEPTKFVLAGDPVAGTGWYEGDGWPNGPQRGGDRRQVMAAGPFNLAPGDTQEIALGIMIAKGISNINSISKLIYTAQTAQVFYNTNLVTDVNEISPIPFRFELFQNYPNPFNSTTIIKYSISVKTNVELKVFDILGREINTLVNEEKEAGSYKLKFNGSNLSSGIYFYRLKAGDFLQTKKLLYLK